MHSERVYEFSTHKISILSIVKMRCVIGIILVLDLKQYMTTLKPKKFGNRYGLTQVC